MTMGMKNLLSMGSTSGIREIPLFSSLAQNISSLYVEALAIGQESGPLGSLQGTLKGYRLRSYTVRSLNSGVYPPCMMILK